MSNQISQIVSLVVGQANDKYPSMSNMIRANGNNGEEVSFSKHQADAIERYINSRIDGYQLALTMICNEKCPYRDSCPLAMTKTELPTGKHCPLEQGLFGIRVAKLCAELNVDMRNPKHYIDNMTIREVAVVEMLMERLSAEIARDPLTVQEQVVGISGEGEPVLKDEVTAHQHRLDQLVKRKFDLLKTLSATRKERISQGLATGEDPSQYFARLQNKKTIQIEASTKESGQDPDKLISVSIDPRELE